MEINTEKARRILDQARQAVREQDYALALEHYEWFFDHALDEDQASLYGVRLSYCLDEWAQVGEKYAPARARLEQKRAESIQQLELTRQAKKFHDFIALCRYTGMPALPVQQFLEYHRSDRELAREIYTFIREQLMAAGQWEVCGAYIEDADGQYAEALELFDISIAYARKNASLGVDDMEQRIEDMYVNKATYLVTVLSHTRRTEEAQRICERANQDMQQRGLKEFLSVYPEDFEE
ncbi:MAG: hypothetical protein V4488_03135 [Pseudomonadota bacterium]